MGLVANMVVRNEADRYLEMVLEDLSTYVDKIVITDDCSTDDTVEICKKYTKHVYSTKEPLFAVDESALRQQGINNLDRHATRGDWILAIDADEIVWATKTPIKELLRTNKHDVIALDFVNMWNATHYRVDKMWKPTKCTKLYRYMPGGKIREQKLACGSEPTYVQKCIRIGRYMHDSGLKIQHLGYMRDEDKQAKFDRYMKIDGGKYHAGSHIRSILDTGVELVEWDFEKL